MRRLAPALLAAVSLAGCGGPSETPVAPASTRPGVEDALRGRLEAKLLSVEWVACIDSGQVYAGERVFRCNVNFGDPHVVPYCAAVLAGKLETDRERKDMRCYRPEDAERYRKAALLDEDG